MAGFSVKTGIRRALLLALCWWALTEDATAWAFGLPIVLLALAASFRLGLSAVPPTLRGLPRFLGFFLWYSLRGGLDVARRALHPGMPLAPAFVDFPLRLSEPAARVFLANTVNLLPGTLITDLAGRRLRVHVLDRRMAVPESLRMVEERVAALFGLSFEPPAPPEEAPDA
jgi:multicomponent Na+:H+ antiporter subunit E